MKPLATLALLLAACASAPKGPGSDRAVYEGYTIDQVRSVAVEVLGDLGSGTGSARVTEDGRVVGEYHEVATFEIRFRDQGDAVAAEIEIETETVASTSCYKRRMETDGGRPGGRTAVPVALEGGQVERVSRAVASGFPSWRTREACSAQVRTWTGKGEAEILEEIGARLESGNTTADLPG